MQNLRMNKIINYVGFCQKVKNKKFFQCVYKKGEKRKKMFVSPLVIKYEEYFNHFLYYDVIIQVENQLDSTHSSPPIYCQRSILQDRSTYFKGISMVFLHSFSRSFQFENDGKHFRNNSNARKL